jgi:hypothetical protein
LTTPKDETRRAGHAIAEPEGIPAIKGFRIDWTCQPAYDDPFQYEIGTSHRLTGPVVIGKSDFHAIQGHPLEVFDDHPPAIRRLVPSRIGLRGLLSSALLLLKATAASAWEVETTTPDASGHSSLTITGDIFDASSGEALIITCTSVNWIFATDGWTPERIVDLSSRRVF